MLSSIINEDSNNVTAFAGEMVFLVQIFVKLILIVLILKKMILKLLFMSDFWFGVIHMKNAKHVKQI